LLIVELRALIFVKAIEDDDDDAAAEVNPVSKQGP
jgi:hypothetical protein